MSQVMIISLVVLIAVIGVGAAALETLLVRLLQFHFGVEPGVRDQEARRRFKAFKWHCWKAYGCISGIFSLQQFRGPPFDMFADLSGILTPLQVVLAIGAACFALTAAIRFREPFSY